MPSDYPFMGMRGRREPAPQKDRNTEGANQAATPEDDGRVSEFHARSGQSHAEARKLLTGLATGSLGVLFVALTSQDAPDLNVYNYSRPLAIATFVSMALSAGFGIAAWKADAYWAYKTAKIFQDNPELTDPPRETWHGVKSWCDSFQATLFVVGLFLAALLTLTIL